MASRAERRQRITHQLPTCSDQWLHRSVQKWADPRLHQLFDMGPNFSYGSYRDGQVVDRQRFFYTTPGAPNNGAPVPVVINEFLASNTNSLIDPATGRYDDWIELYNFGSVPIDLSGFYLTDDLTKKKQWAFPVGTTIAAGDICWFGQTMPRLIALRAICTRIFN